MLMVNIATYIGFYTHFIRYTQHKEEVYDNSKYPAYTYSVNICINDMHY